MTDAISEGNFAILVAPFILTVLKNTDGNSLRFYVLRWTGFTLVPGWIVAGLVGLVGV